MGKLPEALEQKRLDFIRRGALDKARWLENIDSAVLPSQLRRIQQNDKSVLRELVVPSWVDWDLLYTWAQSRRAATQKGARCILCDRFEEAGIVFREKYICDACFLKLKNLE